MAEYKFNECSFDITKFGGRVKIQDAYPELLAYKEYAKVTEREWKIGILISDIGSPFIGIKDFNKKLSEIFSVLKIEIKKNKELFDVIINHKETPVFDIVSFILEYQNNNKFTQWFMGQEMFNRTTRMMNRAQREGEDEDSYFEFQYKQNQKLETLRKQLDPLELELFGTAAMKAAVFRSKSKLKRNYAEKYAMQNQVE